MAVWHDIAEAGEAEYNTWHTRQHMPERLGRPARHAGSFSMGSMPQPLGPVGYRHLHQVFSSRLGRFDREWLAVLADAVGGMDRGYEGELGWFSAGNRAVLVRLPSMASCAFLIASDAQVRSEILHRSFSASVA